MIHMIHKVFLECIDFPFFNYYFDCRTVNVHLQCTNSETTTATTTGDQDKFFEYVS